jgi:hypothetical protein
MSCRCDARSDETVAALSELPARGHGSNDHLVPRETIPVLEAHLELKGTKIVKRL